MSNPSEPPQPPRPPEFTPGQASPPPYEPAPEYPPTSQFPPVNYAPPGYQPDYGQPPPPGYGEYPPPAYPGQPGYGPPPRKSNKPLIAVIIAVSLLLCGGLVTSGVLLVQRATQEVQEATEDARDAVDPYLNPSLPTEVPELPTDLPNLPGLNEGPEITVTYEVKGDGPANIVYTEQLGSTPKVLDNVDLPWKVTTKMKGASFISVTATRTVNGDGSIECRATVDKEEVATNSAAGGWATTTCNKLIFN
jgi:hypothetical protein